MENYPLSFLYIFIIISLIGLIYTKNLARMTLILFFLSFLSTGVFLILDAPDVAITESSISALTALFSLFALKDSYKEEEIEDKFKPFLFIVFLSLGGIISFAAADLPIFGNPIFNHHYLDNSNREIGIKAVVTSILASYRAYDTLFETCVILIGSIAILFLSSDEEYSVEKIKEDKLLLIISKLLFPLMILFGLYIQFHGEVSPGGGFQGGAIIATGIILLHLVGVEINNLIKKDRLKYLACLGVIIYYLTGYIGIISSESFLNFHLISQKVGIIIVEAGIGISVCSSLLIIFRGMVK